MLEETLNYLRTPAYLRPRLARPTLLACAGIDEDALAARASSWLIPGAAVYALYETYGFPPEMADEIGREGPIALTVDWEGFDAALAAGRERGRSGGRPDGGGDMALAAYDRPPAAAAPVVFDGYTHTQLLDARVTGLWQDGVAVARVVASEQSVELALDKTAFYPEGGGQAGDGGMIVSANGHMDVLDTQSPTAGLIVHRGVVTNGVIALGDPVNARVSPSRRDATARNHSATHMLHAALRSVLGSHVRQAGASCDQDRLRFDFNHSAPLTPDQLLKVQNLGQLSNPRQPGRVHP